ncbi:tripartite tricarboxylate transporter TctB family protein [Afifella sp. IM 167]|uniref:tripartite tricarboxylate transporter TctB family protein n=1 Tax=Afifella sp. IM 167 TaxID=2033586 RepID=UPI001CCA72AA|nr:tripartite tricarboxylate transporter TctB family protein [Afifella sp. IM 167]MBZ8135159.1 hypothetical protein [Afifella sp. IM 167]
MSKLSGRIGPLLMTAFFIGAAVVLFTESFREEYQLSLMSHAMGPTFFPRIVLGAMVALGILVAVESLRGSAEKVDVSTAGRVVGIILVTVLYGAGIGLIGFLFSSFLFVLAASLMLGYRRIVVVLPVAAFYSVAVWYLFQEVLLIILPGSPWFNSF